MTIALVDRDCAVDFGRKLLSGLDSVFDKLGDMGARLDFYFGDSWKELNVVIKSNGSDSRNVFNEGEIILDDLITNGRIKYHSSKCYPVGNGLIDVEYKFSIDGRIVKLNYHELACQ